MKHITLAHFNTFVHAVFSETREMNELFIVQEAWQGTPPDKVPWSIWWHLTPSPNWKKSKVKSAEGQHFEKQELSPDTNAPE